jgi:hypothetical protein
MSVATIPQTDPNADAIGRRAFLNAGAGLAVVGSPAAAAVPLHKLGARQWLVQDRIRAASSARLADDNALDEQLHNAGSDKPAYIPLHGGTCVTLIPPYPKGGA